MTAPVTPKPGESPQPPSQSGSDSGNQAGSSQAPTPPTNPPAPTPTDPPQKPEYVVALENQLRSQQQQILDYQRREQQQTQVPTATATTTRTPEQAREELFNDPDAMFGRFKKDLLNDIKETIAPFGQYISEARSLDAYGRAKETIRNDPRFSPHWDRNVETTIDHLVKQAAAQGMNLNEQALTNMAITVIGYKVTNQLPVVMLQYGIPYTQTAPSAPAPVVNNQPNNGGQQPVTNPPYIPPSPAPQPQSQSTARRHGEPTEDERRIMKENNFKTYDEYKWWMQLTPQSVATAKYPGEGKW
jgi:hypothetical protein